MIFRIDMRVFFSKVYVSGLVFLLAADLSAQTAEEFDDFFQFDLPPNVERIVPFLESKEALHDYYWVGRELSLLEWAIRLELEDMALRLLDKDGLLHIQKSLESTMTAAVLAGSPVVNERLLVEIEIQGLNEEIDINDLLYLAIEEHNLDVARVYVQHGASLPEVIAKYPVILHDSVGPPPATMFWYLLANGMSLNSPGQPGWSLLYRAIDADNPSVVAYLALNGIDPNEAAPGRHSPFAYAVTLLSRGEIGRGVLETLIEVGVDPCVKDRRIDFEKRVEGPLLVIQTTLGDYLETEASDEVSNFFQEFECWNPQE